VFLSVNLGPYMEPFISVSSSSNNVELPFISVFSPFPCVLRCEFGSLQGAIYLCFFF
jgi:hypothetical protein